MTFTGSFPFSFGAFLFATAPSIAEGFSHGSNAVVKLEFDGSMVDVSGYLRAAKLNRSAELRETTGIDSTCHEFISGRSEDTLSFEGFFDPVLAGQIRSLDDAETNWEYFPAGDGGDQIKFSGAGRLQADGTRSAAREANRVAGVIQGSGALLREAI